MATGLNKNLITIEIKNRVFLLIEQMESAIRRVVNENNDNFNNQVDIVQANIITIINDNEVGEAISDLYSAYDLVGSTARTRYLLARELFGFGDTETNIEVNADLTSALETINVTAQFNNMALAYDNSVNIEFQNELDLQEVIVELDAEYQNLINKPIIDSDTRIALLNLKTKSIELLSALDLNSISTVSTNQISSRALSYQYYGTTELSDEIVELNKASNTAFIEGDVQILNTQ